MDIPNLPVDKYKTKSDYDNLWSEYKNGKLGYSNLKGNVKFDSDLLVKQMALKELHKEFGDGSELNFK